MQEVKYYCDKCKKEVKAEELMDVKIELEVYDSFSGKRNAYSKFGSESKVYELCDDCIIRLGFAKVVKKENGEEGMKATTADKLYDIVATMIEESKE